MSKVGKSEIRVDAFDKVTGRTKYYEDRMPAGALYARIKHSTIAHGFVKSVDKSAAEAIPGVVKVLTCFDVPEHCFPTAGHPWSMDPGHLLRDSGFDSRYHHRAVYGVLYFPILPSYPKAE